MAAPTFSVTDDLSWAVEKRPLYFTGNDGQPVAWPEKVAVVRNDTGRCLGVVSRDYETVQNSDLLSLLKPMVSEGLLTIENTGYLNHGSRVFAQACLNKEYQVIGEEYKAYVTILNGHVGNASVAIGSTMTRVICGNSFTSAYSDISEKYRHSAGVTQKVLDSTFVIDYVNGALGKYAEYMEKLAGARCTGSQFKEYLEAVYEKPVDKMREYFVAQLNDLFYSGRGNEGRTLHDAFAACTDYSSNQSRKTESGRFLYSQFGQGARSNIRALQVGLELAAV
jgi:phage/plasmid-like protein (TIGR03299 family)